MSQKTHDYKVVDAGTFADEYVVGKADYYKRLEACCNHWAERGYRVVSVQSDTILLERPVGFYDPQPVGQVEQETRKTLEPVFVGRTPDDEKIVIYKHVDNESQLHILRPDGELWALSPNRTITTLFNSSDAKMHVKVESPEWSGSAKGDPHDLFEEDMR